MPRKPERTPPAEDLPATDTAKPVDRQVKRPTVKVRAETNLVEWPNGERVFIAAGKEGEVEEARLPALGKLVTRL